MTETLAAESSNITRREVLSLAWLATLGAAAIQTVGVVFAAVHWTDPQDMVNTRLRPIDLGYLQPWPAPIDDPVSMRGLWLVKTDRGVLALVNSCTHLGCSFGWKADRQEYVCPCHGQAYDKTGTWLRGPANRSADRFALRVYDGEGKLIAQTDDLGSPVPVTEGVRLEALPTRIIRGAPRPWG